MNDKYLRIINHVLVCVLVVISFANIRDSEVFSRVINAGALGASWRDGDDVNLERLIPECRKQAALTFDDGPSPIYTERLLDGLKERGVRASFFVIGENIEGNEHILKRMAEEGHVIGNHTFSHIELSTACYEDELKEIIMTNEAIYEACNKSPRYIRPPYGSWNENLTYNVDLQEVLWDVDPLDWQTDDVGLVVSRIKDEVYDGSIILLHDIYESSVEAALEVVDELKSEGYEFVTIDELLID